MKRFLIVIMLVTVCLAAAANAGEPATSGSDRTDTKLVVFYFHNTWRCPSCNSIESLTRAAIFGGVGENSANGTTIEVESPFSPVTEDGAMTFEAVNIDREENKPLFEAVGSPSKLPVIAEMRANRVADFSVFPKVWPLLSENEDFIAYVQALVRRFINRSSTANTKPVNREGQ